MTPEEFDKNPGQLLCLDDEKLGEMGADIYVQGLAQLTKKPALEIAEEILRGKRKLIYSNSDDLAWVETVKLALVGGLETAGKLFRDYIRKIIVIREAFDEAKSGRRKQSSIAKRKRKRVDELNDAIERLIKLRYTNEEVHNTLLSGGDSDIEETYDPRTDEPALSYFQVWPTSAGIVPPHLSLGNFTSLTSSAFLRS